MPTDGSADAGVDHAAIFAALPTAYLVLDRDLVIVDANTAYEQVLGRRRADLVGRPVFEAFPPEPGALDAQGRNPLRLSFERARDTGEPDQMPVFSYDVLDPTTGRVQQRFWSLISSPVRDADGRAQYVLQRVEDITDYVAERGVLEAERQRSEVWQRRVQAVEGDLFLRAQELQAAQGRVREAAGRLEVLNRVSEQLSGTMDIEAAAAALPQLIVPALADWCIVTLVAHEARASLPRDLRDVGSWHVDPARRSALEEYAAVRQVALGPQSPVMLALRSAEPTLIDRATQTIAGQLRPGRARDLLVQLAPASAAVLPLRARGRTLGLMSLYWDSGPVPRGEAFTAAQDVAARAGLALDNARLYREQRQLAEGLQRSMLTAPAAPAHAQVVVRYVAAAEAAHVGGDWYDCFVQPAGTTVVVIGDVVGHDTDAAAAMGQVRSLLRGIAVTTGEGAAAVLHDVDRAMESLQMSTTATAVVARLEQNDDERARGVTQVIWSNAGHPPPMVVHPDGSVVALTGAQADLLLGVVPDAAREDARIILERGATLLLYTDGLVERRDQPLDEGLLRLRETIEDLAGEGLDLDQLCDGLLARMLPAAAEDDVALLAVRLHPRREPVTGRG